MQLLGPPRRHFVLLINAEVVQLRKGIYQRDDTLDRYILGHRRPKDRPPLDKHTEGTFDTYSKLEKETREKDKFSYRKTEIPLLGTNTLPYL